MKIFDKFLEETLASLGLSNIEQTLPGAKAVLGLQIIVSTRAIDLVEKGTKKALCLATSRKDEKHLNDFYFTDSLYIRGFYFNDKIGKILHVPEGISQIQHQDLIDRINRFQFHDQNNYVPVHKIRDAKYDTRDEYTMGEFQHHGVHNNFHLHFIDGPNGWEKNANVLAYIKKFHPEIFQTLSQLIMKCRETGGMEDEMFDEYITKLYEVYRIMIWHPLIPSNKSLMQ